MTATVRSVKYVQNIEQRLADAEATIEALLTGQIDAMVDAESKTPLLLAKAQSAMRDSEERYRRIVETANEGIWTADNDSKITFVNGRLAEILGYSVDEIVGRSISDFLPETMGRGEGSSEVDEETGVQLARSDGSELWVLLKTSAIRDAQGAIVGTLAMMTDKTRRRQAEQALRTSEVRFRRLWESGIILIAISDAAGKIVEINDAGLRMLGYPREELLAGRLGWDDLTASEWRKKDSARAQHDSSGVAIPCEKELIRKDGSRVSVLAAAALVDGQEGIAIAVDLSDRKRAERHLLERMRIAALSADVGIALTHEDSLRTTLDRCVVAIAQHLDVSFARIWTLDAKAEVLELQASAGRPVELHGPHGRVPVGQLEVGRIAKHRASYRTNDIARDSRPGDPSWDGITAFAGYPLLVNNVLVGVLAIFATKPISEPAYVGLAVISDIVAVGIQRKQVTHVNAMLELQLRQAQKMEAVGRLAGGIAHDFNNILSVIMSYSEFLREDLKPLDPARSDVEEICKAADRAATLTRQLLMFSRQQVLEPIVLELATITKNMETMLRRVVREDVDLVFKHTSTFARVCVDVGSLEQVIMNLAVNARDAMPTGGTLTIESSTEVVDDIFTPDHHAGIKPGRYVVLLVTDTGSGMDPATQARIFEPFFTTKEVGKGTGLGLSTVFGIVEQSGGAIRVRTELGVGTTFSIYLPQVDAPLDTPISQVRALSRGTETILVLEDEEQVRAVTCAILKRHGYRVIEMRTPAEAQRYCQDPSPPIDLLLTDVVMPKVSGPELARTLVEMRPGLRVLCMSGYSDHNAIDLQGFALLPKPFTVESLTRKVRELLDAPPAGP